MNLKAPKFKGSQIDAAQKRLIILVALSVVVTIFCLVSTKALLDYASYHRRELSAKRAVIKQLEANIAIANNLGSQYQSFNSVNPNFIGGKNTTDPNTLPPDGDNARLVLDALPSKYDFPALISSVSKILTNAGIANPGIAGSDLGATVNIAPSVSPSPVEIPLSINGSASYTGAQNLIRDLERSIRPFNITTLDFGGTNSNVSISAGLTTYFQPAKALGASTTKEVK